MATTDLVPTAVQLVCELSGVDTALTPPTSNPRLSTSAAADVIGQDIALPWHSGHDDQVLSVMGDIVGSDSRRPGVAKGDGTLFNGSEFTSLEESGVVHSTQVTKAALAFVGGAGDTIVLNNGGMSTDAIDELLDASTYISIATGVGPGGLAIFTYESMTAVVPPVFNKVKLLAGGGNVVAGQAVWIGDPRTGFRGSLLARTVGTDIRNGYALTYDTDSAATGLKAGVAWEALPFPSGDRYGAGRTLQSRGDYFLRAGAASTLSSSRTLSNAAFSNGTGTLSLTDASQFATAASSSTTRKVTLGGGQVLSYTSINNNNLLGCTLLSGSATTVGAGTAVTQSTALGSFYAVSSIERVNGWTEITTTSPHGIPITAGSGRPTPVGPHVMVVGYGTAVTTCRTAGQSLTAAAFAGGTGVLDVVATAGGFATFLTGASSPKNRIAVQTTTGWAVLSYTGKTTGATPTFTGCTLISGTGSTVASGGVWQGVTRTGSSIGGRVSINDTDMVIWDVTSTTKIRVLLDTVTCAGGDGSTAFVFLPYNEHIGSPLTVARDGNIAWGACSVPKTGASHNLRQVIFSQGTYWHGQSAVPIATCDCWISDDDGATFSIAYSFENQSDFNAPVVGISPFHHTDGYVYSITTPVAFAARIPEGSIHLKASWEFWNGSSWSSTIPSETAALWALKPSNAISLFWFGHATHPCWVATYTRGFTIFARFADAVTGPWGPERRVCSYADFDTPGKAEGLIYGGFPHPMTRQSPQSTDDFYMVLSIFNPYETYLLRFTITDPGDAPMTKKQVQPVSHSTNATLVDPVLQAPTLQNPKGWNTDRHLWTRTGANQFTIPVDATSTGEDYLEKYMPISVIDNGGTRRYAHVLSFSVAAGVTTVNVIPHSDGSSAGNVFASGAFSTGIGWYSYADKPPHFPGTFAYPCAPTGYSAVPSSGVYTYAIRGDRMTVSIREANLGTSNATTKTYPLPTGVASVTRTNYFAGRIAQVRDNGGASTNGYLLIGSNATAISAYVTIALTAWTASGTAGVGVGDIEFELAA